MVETLRRKRKVQIRVEMFQTKEKGGGGEEKEEAR